MKRSITKKHTITVTLYDGFTAEQVAAIANVIGWTCEAVGPDYQVDVDSILSLDQLRGDKATPWKDVYV